MNPSDCPFPCPMLENPQMLQEMVERSGAHSTDLTRPYEGITEVVEKLAQDFPVAIVSNKPDNAVKDLSGFWFPGIYALGETADCPRKPAPDMVYQGMAAIGVEKCIYVGDSEGDVTTAHNAGAKCISVLWGFRDEEELRAAGADYLCKQVCELNDLINQAANEE